MKKTEHKVSIRLAKVINVLLMVMVFAGVWYGYYAERAQVHYYRRGDYVLIALFAILYFILCRSYDAFHVLTSSVAETVYSQGLALLIADGAMYMVIWLLSLHMPNVFPMMNIFVVQLLIALVWAVITQKSYFFWHKPKKTAVVYDIREGLEHLVGQYGLDKKFEVCRVAQVEECLSDLSILDECETVFVSGVHSHDRNIILKYCIENGIELYVIPRVGDVIMSGADRVHMFHLPMLQIGRYNPVPEYSVIKRVFDIVFSGTALLVLSPFMLITALAVKSDGGPALYKQRRLTKDGKEFDVLKFRSMRVDAEKDGVARLSTGEKDERITPVGRIIRSIRFDELPQFINILKGDMSIVGPRPERPEIASQYEEEMPEFRLRLQAKAGLTGYAQVYGKYNTTPYDKLLMDLMYISNPSILEDLKICFATVKILFMRDSTEGIAEGQTTASAGRDEIKGFLKAKKQNL